MTVFPSTPIEVEERDGGAFWNVVLDRPKGNVLDTKMVEALTELFTRAQSAPALRAICVSGRDKHFSFGASVEEHLPDQVEDMLSGFHAMFRVLAAANVTVIAAVRGQCLGGGLELAAFAHRLIASPDARLGQPEIQLGVIAPVASALLHERVGRPMHDHLCVTGEVIDAERALVAGLVDEVVEDPVARAYEYYEEHLRAHSASSLRFAVRAARFGLYRRILPEIEDLEHVYLSELQPTHDAKEGIQAFVEKRKPQWRNE